MVLPRYLPIIGGAEVQCSRLIREFNKTGKVNIVSIVTRRVSNTLEKREYIDNIPVTRIPPSGTGMLVEYIFCLLLIFYLLLNHKKYDVIHCHASSIFGLSCSLVGFLLKKKVIIKISTNGEIGSMQSSSIKRCISRFLSKYCTYIALNSEGYSEVNCYLSKAHKCIIPNGIDFNINHEKNLELATLIRKKLHKMYGEDIYICVFVGRFVKRKGIREIYECGADLTANGKKIIFVLIGDSELQRDAINFEYDHLHNFYIAGRKKNVFPYLIAGDLFISPSHKEGLPNTVLEALSVGKVCILSDILPHQEIAYEHPKNVILFKTGDAQELKQTIINYLELNPHKSSLHSYVQIEDNVLLNKYSISCIAEQYCLLYKDKSNAL